MLCFTALWSASKGPKDVRASAGDPCAGWRHGMASAVRRGTARPKWEVEDEPTRRLTPGKGPRPVEARGKRERRSHECAPSQLLSCSLLRVLVGVTADGTGIPSAGSACERLLQVDRVQRLQGSTSAEGSFSINEAFGFSPSIRLEKKG